MARHSRAPRSAGHSFTAGPLGLMRSQAVELQASALNPAPETPPFQVGSLRLSRCAPPLARRAPPERERRAVGAPGSRPGYPVLAPACRAAPAPRFRNLQRTRRPLETPAAGSKLYALRRRSDPGKVCAAEPTPYLRWGRARSRRSGAGAAGSSAQPGTHRGVAAVAAARAPRRRRRASASTEGGRGLGAPGRGRARGPRLPAVAPGRYRPPSRALRGRWARALQRGAGDN